jgi:hypothetical protein
MRETLQNLFNFVHDNLGKDNTIIGLTGLKRQNEYLYVDVPKEFRKTYIQNTENNYLLI